MVGMRRNGTRYDQELVDYLVREKMNYFDMKEVHPRDFNRFNLSWDDYAKQCLFYIGHYNSAGNHLFAYSIKDKIVRWLDPKPIPYQSPDQQRISFRGYF